MRIKSLFLSLTIMAVFFLAACESQTPTSDKKTDDVVKIAKLLVVGQIKSDTFLNYPAVIQSRQLSELSFETGGTLSKLLVVEAQKVQKGEVLAKLNQQDLRSRLNSAQSEFNNVNTEYQRAVRLIKEDAISRSVLEQRKSKLDMSKAKLELAKKAVQNSVLIAPYAGNVAKISIQEQQAVQAGKPAISILGEGGLEASINIPASIMALAKKEDDQAPLSYLILNAAPDHKIPTQFKEVSLEADATSQTYQVTFTFDPVDGLNILPGMNATVWFQDPRKLASKLIETKIPLTALITEGEQKYVWVVDKETMTVARRDVMVTDGIGVNLSISSGLEAGETIVVAGVAYLSEGMKVRSWSK